MKLNKSRFFYGDFSYFSCTLTFKCFIDFIENVIFSVVSLLVVRQLNFLWWSQSSSFLIEKKIWKCVKSVWVAIFFCTFWSFSNELFYFWLKNLFDPWVGNLFNPWLRNLFHPWVRNLLDLWLRNLFNSWVRHLFDPKVRNLFDQWVRNIFDPWVWNIFNPWRSNFFIFD